MKTGILPNNEAKRNGKRDTKNNKKTLNQHKKKLAVVSNERET